MKQALNIVTALILALFLCGCSTTKETTAEIPSTDTKDSSSHETSSPQNTTAGTASIEENLPTITKEYKEDGRFIEVHTRSNGDYSEYHYTSNQILELAVDHFANGSRAEFRYAEDGSSSEANYNSDDVLERTVDYFPDGTSNESLYQNGKPAESKYYDQHGALQRYSNFVYHENGYTEIECDASTNLLLSEHEYDFDGVKVKTVFHSTDDMLQIFYNKSGETEYETRNRPDGTRSEIHYTVSGAIEYEYSAQELLVAMTEYDTDHTKLRVCLYDPETGDLQSEEKYEGNILVSHWFTDRYASWDTLDTFQNGIRVQREILWHAGFGINSEIIICDSNGALISGKKTFSDGSYWLTFYTSDAHGEYVNYMESYSSTGTLIELWSGTSRTDLGTWTRPSSQ